MISIDADFRTRLDRMPISRLHIAVLLACGIAFGFDLLEIALGSVLSAVFSSSAATNSSLLPYLLSSAYVGAIIGAPLFGAIADRLGRVVALQAASWLLAATSVAEAFSPDMRWLAACRTLSGLALGAFPPLVISYLTEILPARRRGHLILLVSGIACLGAPAGVFIARGLSPSHPLGLEGWRWAFLIGAAGAAVCAAWLRTLPESPLWLGGRGRVPVADEHCRRLEISPPADARRVKNRSPECVAATPVAAQARPRLLHALGTLYALSFLSPWATVAFPLLSGALLMEKGLGLQNSLLFVGISMFGPALSAPASFFVDRLPRRITIAACLVLMISSAVVFFDSSLPPVLIAAGGVFLFCAAFSIPVMNLYGSELLATSSRGLLMSTAWTLNRVGAVTAPLVLVPILRQSGAASVLHVIAATLVASLLFLVAAPKGRLKLPAA